MKLILVRHGQTILNEQHKCQGWCDSPLTDLGKRQAESLRKVLQDYPIDAVYTSTSERAIDTASTIIEGRNLELNYDRRLKEIYFGYFECSPEPIKSDFVNNVDHNKRDYTIVGGESVEMLQNRMFSFIDDIVNKYQNDETILVVSHGFYIWRMIIDLVYNGEIRHIPMKNACYNVLEYKNHQWNALVLNEVGEVE